MFHAMVLKSKAVFLVLLVLVVCQLSCGLGEDWSTRRLSRHNNNNKVIPPSCGELVLKSQCSENSKCRWCTSEDLDDMCFSKSEALRLPHQVFSCAWLTWDEIYSLLDLRICVAYPTLTNFQGLLLFFVVFMSCFLCFYVWLDRGWRCCCLFSLWFTSNLRHG